MVRQSVKDGMNMRAKVYLWLSLVSVACCFGDCALAGMATNELVMAQGEHWWGGSAGFGTSMPFDASSNARIDLLKKNYSQQCDSLLISDRGRIVYSSKPALITVSKGVIRFVTDGEMVVCQRGTTLREAFLYASKTWFPPSGKTPAELFFTAPQYNTWVELNYQQNQESILKYARGFLAQGCPPGVIMIDDTWQVAYGDWDFDLRRFPDPKGMCDELHKMGFKVMLWICPWVGMDTPAYRRIAFGHNPNDYRGYPTKGGFRMQAAHPSLPAPNLWWNGYSALLDFTHPNARAWFKEQLDRLVKDYGVDGFKFDAGDCQFYKEKEIDVYDGQSYDMDQTRLWAKLAKQFPYNELRACWGEQSQPVIIRLGDQSYSWNAVASLVPSLVNLGLMGYQFTCPDMIGGGLISTFQNVKEDEFDSSLIIRSCQIHSMMPMMQFSLAPWRILKPEHMAIIRKCSELHVQMGPYIKEQTLKSAQTGEPIVRHMDYEFPGEGFEAVTDQYMLGDRYLVAPVYTSAEERTVRLPRGRWRDEQGKIYKGGKTYTIAVPLDRIPYFERIRK